MAVPPIPEFLAHLPTRSGLAVPYISMQVGDRVYLGQTRTGRIAECLVSRLCQVCGRPLRPPYLFLVTQQMIDDQFSPEPPLHPVCAAYTVQACPMVGGRMATYAKHQPDLSGTPCDVPGCDCPGIVGHGPSSAGESATPWFRLWCADYAVGVRDLWLPLTVGNVSGAGFGCIVKIRPITTDRKLPWTSD